MSERYAVRMHLMPENKSILSRFQSAGKPLNRNAILREMMQRTETLREKVQPKKQNESRHNMYSIPHK